MKTRALILLSLSFSFGPVALAAACPQLSGNYGIFEYTDPNGTRAVDPTQVKIHVQQTGCATYEFTEDRVIDPESKIILNVSTNGEPVLYIAGPDETLDPDEYTSFEVAGNQLLGKILYLYVNATRMVDTGARLTAELDPQGNLFKALRYPDGQGGLKIVESIRARRE
jgi:hypothetical protein